MRSTTSRYQATYRSRHGKLEQLGEVQLDDVVCQLLDLRVLPARCKDLEAAEAHMGRRHAHEHRAGFDLLAIHRRIAADDRQRTRRRNAEAVHRFAAEILAHGGAKHGASVTHSGEPGQPGALHLHVPPLVPAVYHFAEQDRAAVAELRHPHPELVPGVDCRERLAARQ